MERRALPRPVGIQFGQRAETGLGAPVQGRATKAGVASPSTQGIGPDRLHGIEFAGRHLFESSRVKDEIYAWHGLLYAVQLPHVPDVELEFRITVIVPHIILLLFVSGKDADLRDISFEQAPQDCIAEAACTAGDEQGFVLEHAVIQSWGDIRVRSIVSSFSPHFFSSLKSRPGKS